MKILVLGGYGVFGGRLTELLSDVAEIEFLVCGRDLSRATVFCARGGGRARLRPLQLDRRDIAKGLAAEQPDLVVDASGPFQDYGEDPYVVIKACVAAAVDYLDFADAAEFVFAVAQFDAAARRAGVFVLSGVSSFPVLTAAVLREMVGAMTSISVEAGIAPSPFAGVGLNVMRAVLGYAGAPVKLLRDGRSAYGVGLAESRRFTVAAPGRLPLRNLRFSLVDTPDLRLIPPEYPTMTDIWIGAGPAPEFLHRILNLLAKARARFGSPALTPLARLCYAVLNRLKFGEHRGGMFVRARGVEAGEVVERSWHMLAEGDDGPYIPSMAIEALVRKMLAGERPAAGARSAIRALDLADYEALFRNRAIFAGFRCQERDAPLYRRILGSSFALLPQKVRELHDSTATRRWVGYGRVRRGRGVVANAVALLFGFPRAAARVAVAVTFSPEGASERWTRDFGGKLMSSVQTLGEGRNQYLLVERFGPVALSMALVVEPDRLSLILRRWSLFGLPLPKALMPFGPVFECEANGDYRFQVEISAPLVGLIVAYDGVLAPEATARASGTQIAESASP